MTWLQIMPWIMSAVTVTSVWLTGNKSVYGWYLGLFGQSLWIVYIVATHTWGFIPTTAFLCVIHTRNALKWRREDIHSGGSPYGGGSV